MMKIDRKEQSKPWMNHTQIRFDESLWKEQMATTAKYVIKYQ